MLEFDARPARHRLRPRWVHLGPPVLGLFLLVGLPEGARAELGEVGWNDFRVSYGDPALDDQVPAVAYSPAHDVYLVAWLEEGAGPFSRRIVARRLNGSGRALGGEIVPFDVPACTSAFCPSDPAVAYSPTADRFVVAVALDDVAIGQAADEFEILAWDVDPETGTNSWISLLSDAGGLGDPEFDALDPAVACSSATTECLVVWWGDDNVGGLVAGETEIFAQRFNAATGDAVGNNDFRVSDLGGTGDDAFDALFPAVAYNGAANEYLVVWHGDDNVGGLVDGEAEIFGQRLNAATGTAQGVNDFRVSDMGGTGNSSFDGSGSAVVYNAGDDEYLVVWTGDDDMGGLVDEEAEIFAQRLTGATGTEVGGNDFRVSDLGGTGDANFDAGFPRVAYDPSRQEYLVVWHGDDNVGGLQDFEAEIFGQRLAAATGAETGGNDFRLSDMGGTGDNPFDALFPDLAYNSTRGQFLAVWTGNDDVGGLEEAEQEVFAQRLGEQEVFADGFETGDTSAWDIAVP
jgi:hypothetical protein